MEPQKDLPNDYTGACGDVLVWGWGMCFFRLSGTLKGDLLRVYVRFRF